ncbi:hypothetical protein E2C01_052150 [Portunus trituberculatus]|uniref:Uncharacterized protein n=1 Tax=Portunus trituberculatus TaxID=210409 RepID=A0A5B7GL54_PORTR|nr:hypothetical protein [Portunus trituberculatus]
MKGSRRRDEEKRRERRTNKRMIKEEEASRAPHASRPDPQLFRCTGTMTNTALVFTNPLAATRTATREQHTSGGTDQPGTARRSLPRRPPHRNSVHVRHYGG